MFLPREKKHRYYLDHREGLFYIRTNKSGRNFAIMTAPENDPAPKNWKVFLAHRDDVRIAGHRSVQGFRGRRWRKSQALDHLRDPQFQDRHVDTRSRFRSRCTRSFPAARRITNRTTYRYNYQSFVTPSSVFDYDVTHRQIRRC